MTVKKNWIPCNLCGGDQFKLIYQDELGEELPPVDYNFRPETRKTFAIVRCLGCGLVFTNPMPELCGAYQGVVDPIYLASEMQRRETARNVMRRIRQHSPNGGRLLDIGCNTGIFLDEAAKSFEVMGVELSKWAAAEASKRHAVNMVPVSHLEVTKKFDVVTLFGVIEHFDNPIQELHAIARVLKPGGLFVVYTGDVEALLPRILGKRWWWFQGMHLFYFSLRTLSLMLNRTGFDVVESDNYTVYFQLFSLGISLKRYSIGKILAPILNLPLLRNRLVGIKLSGEMLIFSRRRS